MPDVPGPCGRAGLPVRKMITPEPCLSIWLATARAVMKLDRKTVFTGVMNCSIAKSTIAGMATCTLTAHDGDHAEPKRHPPTVTSTSGARHGRTSHSRLG